MKILFVVGEFISKRDANIIISEAIIDELKVDNHISIIGSVSVKQQYGTYHMDGCIVHNIYIPNQKSIRRAYIQYSKIRKSVFSIIKNFIIRPNIFVLILLHKISPYINEKKIYKRKIKHVLKKEQPDIIIAISNPFYTVEALSEINTDKFRIAYFLDPYAFYEKIKADSFLKALERESRVCEKMDWIFVTEYILKENQNNQLSIFKSKMSALPHPSIKLHKYTNREDNIKFDKNKINCLFVGRFYSDIRNPEFILELFTRLNNDFVFYIIGSGAEEIIKKYKMVLEDRLIICGSMMREKAFNAMHDADILINIGNTVSNQLPTKILDYISTGKPIINLYKIDGCISLLYTSIYPLCLNIKEDISKVEYYSKLFQKFCKEVKGSSVDKNHILKMHKRNTPAYVSRELMKVLNRIYQNV